MADQFDQSGLVGGSAEWTLTPDQGVTLDGGYRSPNFGADTSKTDSYPSQEPRDAADYDPDLQAIVNAYNAHPVAHGADMSRTSASGSYNALPEKG